VKTSFKEILSADTVRSASFKDHINDASEDSDDEFSLKDASDNGAGASFFENFEKDLSFSADTLRHLWQGVSLFTLKVNSETTQPQESDSRNFKKGKNKAPNRIRDDYSLDEIAELAEGFSYDDDFPEEDHDDKDPNTDGPKEKNHFDIFRDMFSQILSQSEDLDSDIFTDSESGGHLKLLPIILPMGSFSRKFLCLRSS